MPTAVNVQVMGNLFNNVEETVRIVYDFAVDGGATGAYTLATIPDMCVITHAHATVKTACTSGGSATVIWGTNGTTNLFMNTTQGAVASLTANAVVVPPAVEGAPNALPLPVRMAAGTTLVATIATAALTAGKIEFVVNYMKA